MGHGLLHEVLGCGTGRDEQLMLRFIDHDHLRSCTSNPLTKRAWRLGADYELMEMR